MANANLYAVTVRSTVKRSPHVRRLVLAGASLERFPEDYEGGYVKLLLPRGDAVDGETIGFLRRSFTIRAFERARCELILEFVEHQPAGPATRWAMEAAEGDQIVISGPGAVKRPNRNADWALLAGDLTGLPAISVHLERLPSHMKGLVFIEAPSEEDQVPLHAPGGFDIHWVLGPRRQAPSPGPLEGAVLAAPWADGRVTAWVACEFSAMKRIRSYLTEGRGLRPEDLYISSYWKRGASDEEHKAAKRAELSGGP